MKASRMLVGIGTFAVLGFASTAFAANTFYSQFNNPTQNIPQVADYQTTGADMGGMEVTMYFEFAAPETAIWAPTGVDSGAASGLGGDWTLSQSQDSFSNPWTLLYTAGGNKGRLTGFRLDGFAAGPGNVGVMFDRTFGGQFGTPDSWRGRDFELVGPEPFDIIATYEGAIGVAGNAPVGDEFRWLSVNFMYLPDSPDEFSTLPPLPAGLDGSDLRSISFYQDTNNPIVPEPATLAMLAAALFVLRRR